MFQKHLNMDTMKQNICNLILHPHSKTCSSFAILVPFSMPLPNTETWESSLFLPLPKQINNHILMMLLHLIYNFRIYPSLFLPVTTILVKALLYLSFGLSQKPLNSLAATSLSSLPGILHTATA